MTADFVPGRTTAGAARLGPIVVATGPDEPVDDYLAALAACGADASRLRVVSSQVDTPEAAAALLADASGLVLCGGADVAPELYGEPELADAELVTDHVRDAFEIRLLDTAREQHVPVFGVCRGLQIINVFLGGTLYQHLPAQHPGALRHAVDPQSALAHAVFAEPDGHPLANLLRSEPCVVNSSHHQGIRRLAPRLATLALSADDLIEAAALPPAEPWWLCGVQWHPENLVELPLQRELWQRFLRECAA
jgi:putative glutamine amidotransferase